MAARLALAAVCTFIRNSRCQPSARLVSSVSQRKPPAMFRSASRPPKRSATASMAAPAATEAVRWTPPSANTSSPVGRPGGVFAKSISATRAPCSAAAFATVEPRAPNAPVMAKTRPAMAGRSLEQLDDRDVGQAAAFAHGLQAPLLVAGLQRVEKRGHQLRARRAQRVAKRDGAAVDVELGRVRARGLQPGHRHRGEGLVHLEEV